MKIKEYIMNELDNGRTIDDLAAEFTNSLNEAKSRGETETRKRELEAKLADTFNEYLRLCPDFDIGEDMTAEGVRKVFEEVFNVFRPIAKLLPHNTYASLDASKLPKEKELKADPIADFLKSLGC